MLTIVIKRSDEPTVIQMTQEAIMKELRPINGAEMLLEDRWVDGLRKVRTPYVCLVEADCTLSAQYISSNFNLMRKTTETVKSKGGGWTRIAMLSSCLGINKFENRIFDYRLDKKTDKGPDIALINWNVSPNRKKPSAKPYFAQIGFVPGAILRMSSIKDVIDTIPWDESNLVRMSAIVSYHLWGTERRVRVNPNTTYVSTYKNLEKSIITPKVPDHASNIFIQEMIGIGL